MSSAVAELENYLQSMLALKPPGVSGSKINSITSLCTANVQVRSLALLGVVVVRPACANQLRLPATE